MSTNIEDSDNIQIINNTLAPLQKIKRRKKRKNHSTLSNYNDYSMLPEYITQVYTALAVNNKKSHRNIKSFT
jgi:hypothetical protein